MRLLVLILIIFAVFCYLDYGNGTCVCYNCSDCTTLLSDIQSEVINCNYILLNSSLNFSETCISASTDVGSLNITLDCQGNWIIGTNSSLDIAIEFSGTYYPFKAKIENCKINGGRIELENLSSLEIEKVNIIYNSSAVFAFYLSSVTNATIDDLNLNVTNVRYPFYVDSFAERFTITNSLIDVVAYEIAMVIENPKYFKATNLTVKYRGNDVSAVFFNLTELSLLNLTVENSTIVSTGNCLTFQGRVPGNFTGILIEKNDFVCSIFGISFESYNYTDIIIKDNRIKAYYIFSFNSNVTQMKVFNNFFNFTTGVMCVSGGSLDVSWNTTKTPGTNIVGGPYLGGNFWVGYSESCEDNDNDGICDDPYVIDANNTDYLPLTYFEAPSAGGVQEVNNFSLSSLASMVSKKSFTNLSLIVFTSFSNTFAIKYNNKCFGIYNSKLFLGDYISGTCYLNETKAMSYKKGIFIFSCPEGYLLFNGIRLEFSMPCNEDNITIACDHCNLGLIGIKES